MRYHRQSLVLALSVGVLSGCVFGPTTPLRPQPHSASTPVVTTKGGTVTLVGLRGPLAVGLLSQDGGGIISQDGGGLISQDGAGVVSNDGGSVVSNDGSSLISQDGGGLIGKIKAPSGLISQDGGGIVAQGGGNIVAQGGGNAVSDMGGLYHLDALAEQPLAGAHVYLRAADGRFVADAQGRPLYAVADATGAYRFPKLRARAGLQVFVPIAAPHGKVQALVAIVPRDRDPGAATDIDLASTLVGTYVFNQFVGTRAPADRRNVLDHVTDALESRTRQDARGVIGDAVPAGLAGLAAADVVNAVNTLRKGSNTLDDDFNLIAKTIAGVNSTAQGLNASQVPLQEPLALAADAAGNYYIGEGIGGVLRKIAADGTSTELIGPGSTTQPDQSFAQIGALALGPDGLLYFAAPYNNTVYRISTDGKTLELVAGGGNGDAGVAGAKAKDVALHNPQSLAFDAHGTLYIGEGDAPASGASARIVKVAPDGAASVLALPAGDHRRIGALAFDKDGALWAFDYHNGELLRQGGDAAWKIIGKVASGWQTGLLGLPDGGVLVSVSGDAHQSIALSSQQLLRWMPDGTSSIYAGAGAAGADDGTVTSATFSVPAGLAFAPDGTLLVADSANALVRAVKNGQVTTVAGARGVIQVGDAKVVTLNLPGGVVLDPRGRIVVAEAGSGTIKRLEGDKLVRIAGTTAGFAGDGGPAIAAQFLHPVALAYHGDELYVGDAGNQRIRKIDAQGNVTTVVGGGATPIGDPTTRAVDLRLEQLGGMAVSPAGSLHFIDHTHVYRLEANGTVTLVAGSLAPDAPDKDGIPAASAKLGFSAGLAFDAAGNLYITETAALRVRKVAPDGTISTFAGASFASTATKLLSDPGAVARELDVPTSEATLLLPVGVAVGKDGRVYVAEAGTRGIQDAGSQTALRDVPDSLLKAMPVLSGRLRVFGPDGRAHTLAGTGAANARPGDVVQPTGVTFDADGHLVFVDSGTGELRVLTKAP